MNLSITKRGFMRLKKMSSPKALRRTNDFRGVLQPIFVLFGGEERQRNEAFNSVPRDLFRPSLALQVFSGAASHQTFQSNVTFRPAILLNYVSHSAIDRRASTFVTTTRPQQIRNQHLHLRAKESGDVKYHQTFFTTTQSSPSKDGDQHFLSTSARSYEARHYQQLFQLPSLTLRTPPPINRQFSKQINRQLSNKTIINRKDYSFPLSSVDRLSLDVDRKTESLVVARQANAAFQLVRSEMKELLRTHKTEQDKSVVITHRSLGTLALNFAKPRVSQAEEVSKRLATFISAPAMTYAKTQQAFNESALAALHDLRNAKPEAKPTPAPQWPSIEQITAQVRTQMERELRIERQRRGL